MSPLFEDVRLQLPHIELAARLYGPDDGRPVIALHGWLDNAASFERLAPRLSGLRIVALDFAGHGHSEQRPVGFGYNPWDNVHDVLEVATLLGWSRFSLLGHSMGAIVSVLLAASLPERVERLALIDGLIPPTGEAQDSPRQMADALLARLDLSGKRKPVYAEYDRAVDARLRGGPISREAAQLLAQRGLMPVTGGYTWRTDTRLTLPSPLRLSLAHAMAFVRNLLCPTRLVVAENGLLAARADELGGFDGLPLDIVRLAGGHHLHLDDEQGAQLVADCFNPFLCPP